MAECKAISGLKLDQQSIDALERIRTKHAYGNALASVLSAGVVSSIFTKSNSLNAAYNITQTDWTLYSQAMKSIPEITKAAVRKEVQLMIINYQLHYNAQLLQFWKGIYDGCQ